MRRAAIEKSRTLRIWRGHLTTHGGKIACDCELQPGRFRKSQRIGGCGRPRCWLCHFDKLAGLPTVSDLRSFATEREGLAEAAATNLAIDSDTFSAPLLRAPISARHCGRYSAM